MFRVKLLKIINWYFASNHLNYECNSEVIEILRLNTITNAPWSNQWTENFVMKQRTAEFTPNNIDRVIEGAAVSSRSCAEDASDEGTLLIGSLQYRLLSKRKLLNWMLYYIF